MTSTPRSPDCANTTWKSSPHQGPSPTVGSASFATSPATPGTSSAVDRRPQRSTNLGPAVGRKVGHIPNESGSAQQLRSVKVQNAVAVNALIRADRDFGHETSNRGGRQCHKQSFKTIGRLRTRQDERWPRRAATINNPKFRPARVGFHQSAWSARPATRSASD